MLPCTDCGKPNSCSASVDKVRPRGRTTSRCPGRSARASGRGLPGGSGRNATRSVSPRRGCLAQSSDGSRDSRCPSGGYGRRRADAVSPPPGDQLPGLLHIEGKGLIHHHMFAGVQRRAGQRGVRGVRGGDDHQSTSGCWTAASGGGDHRDVRQIAFDLLFIAGSDERRGSAPAPNG